MGSITSTMSSHGATVTIVGSTNATISEVSISPINTKVAFNMQNGLKGIIVRAREISNMKINFDNGLENFTIPKGTCFELSGLSFNGKVLYIEADVLTTAEIIQLY